MNGPKDSQNLAIKKLLRFFKELFHAEVEAGNKKYDYIFCRMISERLIVFFPRGDYILAAVFFLFFRIPKEQYGTLRYLASKLVSHAFQSLQRFRLSTKTLGGES